MRRLRPTVFGVTLGAFAGLAMALAGCRDGGSPPAPGTTTGARQGTAVPPRTGTPSPQQTSEELLAQAQEKAAATIREADAAARRFLDAFNAQVFVAGRDASVRAGEAAIRVVVDGKEGEYLARFDGTRKHDRQVTLETVREEQGLHPGAAAQAKRLAVFAFQGPSSYVLSLAPPGDWFVQKASDGMPLVVTPTAANGQGATYRLDDSGLVAMRGVTDGKNAARTTFRWSWRPGPRGIRAFLDEAVEDAGKARLEFHYAADRDLPLLERALLEEGEHRFEAVLRYARTGRGE